ncbi:MAG: hypothetical protein ACTSPW_17710 [Promethearchaeota archaeon]
MSKKSGLNDQKLENYLKKVREQITLLWKHPNFENWRKNENIKSGDLIIINNSFLLRNDKTTTKNERYISLKVNNKSYKIKIVKWNKKITTDFKKISKNSNENFELIDIEDEVKKLYDELGKLIFILVGKKISDDIIETKIRHRSLKKIIWDSSLDKRFILKNGSLKIKDPYSRDFFPSLYDFLNNNGVNLENDKDLSKKIEAGIKFLKKEAKTILEIPDNSDIGDETFLSMFYKFFDSELEIYSKMMKDIDKNLNEILRISYNFLEDGIKLFKLISNICDLKPLILWGTIYFHFELNQKLMEIPSIIPGKKVDLNYYDRMIKDARNKRFHAITGFKRTLQVNLPTDAIQSSTLIFFSDFSKRRNKPNRLDYKDKKIVDLLTEFYRTEELTLPSNFWEKNYEVIRIINKIFKETYEILKILL